MLGRLLIRKWRWAALCTMLAVAVFISAETTPQTGAQPSKKKAPRHPASHTATSKPHSSTHSSAGQSAHKGKSRGKTRTKGRKRGQQAIDSERAREIQEALIREHYLQGGPSGTWDSATQIAMQRYQADQGWQTKTIPDSRALIKLGLGPSPEHLLNPDSAMTSSVVPASSKADSKPAADDPPASNSSDPPSGDPPRR